MNASDVIKRLNQMKKAAGSEEDSAVLNEALKLISGKEQYKISVPCRIGDNLYSVIGERVHLYVVAGFRIDKEKIYIESEESMFFPEDKIGIYYFFSQELAEREFNRRRRKERKWQE